MSAVFKEEAHKLIDELPATADWSDLIYRAVLRKEIEAGLTDSAANRVTPAKNVLAEFGLH